MNNEEIMVGMEDSTKEETNYVIPVKEEMLYPLKVLFASERYIAIDNYLHLKGIKSLSVYKKVKNGNNLMNICFVFEAKAHDEIKDITEVTFNNYKECCEEVLKDNYVTFSDPVNRIVYFADTKTLKAYSFSLMVCVQLKNEECIKNVLDKSVKDAQLLDVDL